MAGTEPESTGGDAGDGVPRIVHTDDVLGGDPRVEGTRIGVAHVYRRHVEGGESPESIAEGFDISLSAVHAALAYGFANTEAMRAIASRDDPTVDGSDRLVPDDESA